nr:unnamed protein product [Digitaria exilis]
MRREARSRGTARRSRGATADSVSLARGSSSFRRLGLGSCCCRSSAVACETSASELLLHDLRRGGFRFGVVGEASMAGGLRGLLDSIPGGDWVRVSGSVSSGRAPWTAGLKERLAAAVDTTAWSPEEADDNRREGPTAGASGFLG